jgi:hypothetical protein
MNNITRTLNRLSEEKDKRWSVSDIETRVEMLSKSSANITQPKTMAKRPWGRLHRDVQEDLLKFGYKP